MAILVKVLRYLKETEMPPSVFGRSAVNDPRLVGDLRNGREPRQRTCERIEAFIAAHPEAYRTPQRPKRRPCSSAR